MPVRGNIDTLKHKDANRTYDNTTDSLEALADALGGGGSPTLLEALGEPQLFTTDAATVNTITCAELTGTASMYIGQMVVPIEDAEAGIGKTISAYDESNKILTVVPDWTSDPDSGGDINFVIIPSDTYFLYVASKGLEAIFDIVDAILDKTRVGGTHDQTDASSTEDTVWTIDAPAGNWKPELFMLSLSEMASGDTLRVKIYYRMISGGVINLAETDVTFNGAQAIDEISFPLQSNRFGIKITTTQTAGTARDWIWEVYYDG